MFHQINGLFHIFGLHITRYGYSHKPFIDTEFAEIYERNKDKAMGSWEALFDVYNAAKYVALHGIEGDVIECGVWRGGSSIVMAEALSAHGCTDKKILMYDTYAGMTEPGERDSSLKTNQLAHSRWEKSQKDSHNEWAYASLDEVKRNARGANYPFEKFVFVEGDVEATIPATVPQKISLLRLDTDWYSSTHHEMQHLFPLLSIGGVVIVDDYGAYKGARDAVNDYLNENEVKILLNYNHIYGAVVGVKISD